MTAECDTARLIDVVFGEGGMGAFPATRRSKPGWELTKLESPTGKQREAITQHKNTPAKT